MTTIDWGCDACNREGWQIARTLADWYRHQRAHEAHVERKSLEDYPLDQRIQDLRNANSD